MAKSINLDILENPCMYVILHGNERKVPVLFESNIDRSRTFCTPDIDKMTKDELRAFLNNLRARAQQMEQPESKVRPLFKARKDKKHLSLAIDHDSAA